MSIKATFDAATLADAVQKAARVAPNKGAAWDLAAGIVFETDPISKEVIVKATNLDTTYRQVLSLQDYSGDPTVWRLPSAVLAGFVSNLPLGNGSTVTFTDPGDKALRIKSGKVVAMLELIEGDYPHFDSFDNTGLGDASDFARKVAQVSWACAKDGSILSGVYVDGESLIGCNRDVAAIIPCKVPVDRPVTVPLFTLATILRNATDVRVLAAEKSLHMQLDAETQATSRLFEGEYPNVKGLRRTDYTMEVRFSRTAFVESAKRLLVVAQSERMPTMKLTFQAGIVRSITLDLVVPDSRRRIQDSIDVNGDYADPLEIWFTPSLIIPCVENAKDDLVTMCLGNPDPSKASMSIVRVSDDAGYEALCMPRRP